MTKKAYERSSTSLAIKKIQNKATVRCHHTSIRTTLNKNSDKLVRIQGNWIEDTLLVGL